MNEYSPSYILSMLVGSPHFECIRSTKFCEARIKRLMEAGKVMSKEKGEIICEYGAKSNIMFFVIFGTLAVYIPKSEAEVNRQFAVLANLEGAKKAKRLSVSLNESEPNEEVVKL